MVDNSTIVAGGSQVAALSSVGSYLKTHNKSLLATERPARANYLMLCFWGDTDWPFPGEKARVHRMFALHHQVICFGSQANELASV